MVVMDMRIRAKENFVSLSNYYENYSNLNHNFVILELIFSQKFSLFFQNNISLELNNLSKKKKGKIINIDSLIWALNVWKGKTRRKNHLIYLVLLVEIKCSSTN